MLRIYVGFQAIKFYCFPPPKPPLPPPPHFYCFLSSSSTFLLFFLLLLISIVFPPPRPHCYCFSSSSSSFLLFSLLLLILLFSILRPLVSFPSSPRDSIKDCQLPFLVHFLAMSRVVNNNRGFLQLLADCPAYQRQFLLKTATPQQLHALVQVLYNILMRHIPIPEENKRILLPYKDALLNLASPNVPYKTKKRVLVQEGSGFIEDVLAPVVSSLGFLML